MILKTKEFKEAANKILVAADVDKSAANLELLVKDNNLFLNVTNREYYVSVKFPVETTETFHATVDAALFLSLISGITAETFTLTIKNNTIMVTADRSSYKLGLIYEGTEIMHLPVISIEDKTVEMTINNDILTSILNVNSKELLKAKKLDVNELQRLYYIDETGCFTFTTGACLNSFTLEKPIKLLLNDRIVRLFKLFDDDVKFSFGHDVMPNGALRSKVVFETQNVYLAALVSCDDVLLSKIQGPCNAAKNYISEQYSNCLVISSNMLSAAISRLLMFTKNSKDKKEVNSYEIPAKFILTDSEVKIIDKVGNTEAVQLENQSLVEEGYSFVMNLVDVKAVLDSCKNEHITISCGNHRSVIVTHGPINNLISELSLEL